jgi:hypothetical protein
MVTPVVFRPMKIRLSELRSIIREELGREPTPDEAMFYSILNNIADDNGGVLPVTHESLRENLESIRRNGSGSSPIRTASTSGSDGTIHPHSLTPRGR